jgi:hypothetical protein
MESSNTENRDAAIQRLVDEMRIPAENRPAATSDLLELMRRYEERSRFGSPRDTDERFRRISKLCDELLEELDGLTPIDKSLYSVPKRSAAIRELARLASRAGASLPPHRPRGFTHVHLPALIANLFRMQKEHGGKFLTLTNKSGEASGSLAAAQKILHELLPSIVPSRISYSTLNRMRRRALHLIAIHPKRSAITAFLRFTRAKCPLQVPSISSV